MKGEILTANTLYS